MMANAQQIDLENSFVVIVYGMVSFLCTVQIKDQNRNFEASLNFGFDTLTGTLFSLLSLHTYFEFGVSAICISMLIFILSYSRGPGLRMMN